MEHRSISMANSSDAGRPVYTVWLRLAAVLLVMTAVLAWVGRSFVTVSKDPNLPWNEEFRILTGAEAVQIEASKIKGLITRVLRYKADAEEAGQRRGQISLLIYPDGLVKGVWNGEYTDGSGVHRVVMAASFEGNIDASKPYVGFVAGQREGGTALYFITKGTYVFLESEPAAGANHNRAGYMYVRGWLYPDYTALGEIVITKDKRTYETFSWGAKPSN